MSKFLFDWQTMIAGALTGALAIIAAAIAYLGAMRAADRQAAAIHESDRLRRQERLLGLARVVEEVERELSFAANQIYSREPDLITQIRRDRIGTLRTILENIDPVSLPSPTVIIALLDFKSAFTEAVAQMDLIVAYALGIESGDPPPPFSVYQKMVSQAADRLIRAAQSD